MARKKEALHLIGTGLPMWEGRDNSSGDGLAPFPAMLHDAPESQPSLYREVTA